MDFLIGYIIGAICVGLFSILAQEAAYRNGACDGYGYSREPGCPGYAKAGRYLRETMYHRWPELKQ